MKENLGQKGVLDIFFEKTIVLAEKTNESVLQPKHLHVGNTQYVHVGNTRHFLEKNLEHIMDPLQYEDFFKGFRYDMAI